MPILDMFTKTRVRALVQDIATGVVVSVYIDATERDWNDCYVDSLIMQRVAQQHPDIGRFRVIERMDLSELTAGFLEGTDE